MGPGTVANYRSLIDRHLIPALGRHRLRDLAPEHVDRFLRAKADAGLSRSSVGRLRSILTDALTHAERRQLVVRNAGRLSILPATSVAAAGQRALTTVERDRFIATALAFHPPPPEDGSGVPVPHRLGALMAVMLHVELRPGEGTGLRWDDLDTAARTRSGGGRVLLLSAEDDAADTIVPRLMAAGADLSRICLWDKAIVWEEDRQGPVPIVFPDHLPYLHHQLRTFGARLIVDVLMAYLSSCVDSHKDQSVRVLLSRMSDLAAAAGAAIILVRHLNKAGSGPAIYRGGGSIGIIGAARAGYQVIADADDPDRRLFTCVKNNLAPRAATLAYRLEPAAGFDVARVVWDDRPDPRSADELHAGNAAAPTKFAAAVEWLELHGAVHEWETQSADVIRDAAEAGISQRTLDRAAEHAGIVRSGRGGTGRWAWPTPD